MGVCAAAARQRVAAQGRQQVAIILSPLLDTENVRHDPPLSSLFDPNLTCVLDEGKASVTFPTRVDPSTRIFAFRVSLRIST